MIQRSPSHEWLSRGRAASKVTIAYRKPHPGERRERCRCAQGFCGYPLTNVDPRKTLSAMPQWPDDRIAFGGDYNPEQWPREVWVEDMRLMRDAGVSFVTRGVVSWSWLEPTKGHYEFGWLDEIMGMASGFLKR